MRAYSLFEVKSLSDERRILSGMASTPTPDRVQDIVEPLGMKLRGAVNLFLYHKHNMPVGHVEFGRPSKKGIPFEASIPDVVEDGIVKERVKEAWHSVKYRLLQAVSIGFQQLNGAYEILANGGVRYKEWEMLELSLVGIPANPDALVSAFKSFDPARIRAQMMGLEAQANPDAAIRRNLPGIPLVTPGIRLITGARNVG
jgi:HK97 family phage prohead protease